VPKGLDRAQFTGGVEFREQAAARGSQASVDRVGTSESLSLALDGGFSKIKTADFSGNVRFRDKDTTGEAPEARYGVDSKQVALRGGGTLARVTQEDGTIEAKDIDLTLDPRRLIAKGGVRSTLKPGSRKDRKESRASILEDDQPVNVTSSTLDYDGVADRAVYTGDARLWQGSDTVIQADTIVLDDKTGNLEARKNMRALLLVREDPAAGGKTEAVKPTSLRAEEMIYEEARRVATLRGNANTVSAEGNISAQKIEVFLREDGNTLDRVEALDKVTARLEGNRVATGDRMTYNAKTRRYDMTGRPLIVTRQFIDKNAGGQTRCERIEGTTLVFERATESATVTVANGMTSRAVIVPCTSK
jgi:lipopolysaccharide export system protein LptA